MEWAIQGVRAENWTWCYSGGFIRFSDHQFEDGGGTTVVAEQEIVGYETRQTGSQTVVDQPAWDETVTTYETVTVSNAWDETVTTGYVCSGCGATK